jgi:hypothetical protein
MYYNIFHKNAIFLIFCFLSLDDGFSRAFAFQFLDSIHERFRRKFGVRAQTALPYSLNTEFRSVLRSCQDPVARGTTPPEIKILMLHKNSFVEVGLSYCNIPSDIKLVIR